jgi:hypothetical protein
VTKPKSGTIIKKHLDSRMSSIAKDKAVTTQGIEIKLTTTNGSVPINPFPKIDGLACYINFMSISDS